MPTAVDELLADLRHRLAAAADPERAPQMQAYMKSRMPFYGIASPVMKQQARECFRAHPLDEADWLSAAVRLWDEAEHREERYAALAMLRFRTYRAAATRADRLPLYRHLITTGAWWDLVDETAQHLVGGVLRAHRGEVTPVVRAWADDDDIWVRRSAILCQERFKGETDTDLLDAVLRVNLDGSPHGDAFWIRKAMGWALRSYARTDPGWVREWVATHADGVSGLTRREALKHL